MPLAFSSRSADSPQETAGNGAWQRTPQQQTTSLAAITPRTAGTKIAVDLSPAESPSHQTQTAHAIVRHQPGIFLPDTSMPELLDVTTHSFTDCDAQAIALAERIAERLRTGLKARGQAVLAVSGGTTPAPFFARLAREMLDWANVQITLVDERWVPADNPRANAHLVQSTLLQHAAHAARFVPLYTGAATPEAGLAAATARINALTLPFDAVVLGMGDDGHTASFFPDGDHLDAALDLHNRAPVVAMRATSAGEPRITLSLSTLLNTRALYLLISGAHKRDVLTDARLGSGAAQHYPIRAVLAQQRVPVAVYWCP